MWVAIKYWAGARERSPVDIVSLYGYSSTVWILVAVSFLATHKGKRTLSELTREMTFRQWLALIPVSPLRMALAFAATVLSLAFLIRNLYPILSTAPNGSGRLLVIVAVVFHLVFVAALWFGFMAGGTGALDGKELKDVAGTIGGGLAGEVGDDAARMQW